jgi:hypothetical protein
MEKSNSYLELGLLKFRSLVEAELEEAQVGELYCDTRGFWPDLTTIWVCIDKNDTVATYKYVAGWMSHHKKIQFPLTIKMYNVYLA